MPRPLSPAGNFHSRDEYVAYLATALKTGNAPYIAQALSTVAETMGLEGRDA